MKKLSKKVLAVLMCVWNLYLPNNIEEPDDFRIEQPIVEEIDDLVDDGDCVDEEDGEQRKWSVKKIFCFLPTLIYSIFCAIINLILGVFTFHPLAILVLLLLLLAAFLLFGKKYWGCIFGILAGIILIWADVEEISELFEGWQLGTLFIAYHGGLGFYVYQKGKEIKEKVIDKIKIKGTNEEYEI